VSAEALGSVTAAKGAATRTLTGIVSSEVFGAITLTTVAYAAAPQTVDVTVTNPTGTSAISASDNFTYV
jgi:hypothetical protein